MGDETSPQTGGQKRFGCAKMAGVGCLVLVAIGIVAGMVVYFKAKDWARAGIAAVTEKVTEKMVKELGLSEAERESAMEPIREFAQRIRDGEVSLEQGGRVMEALTEGPAFAVLMMHVFERKYLAGPELSEEEKQEGHVTITRFVRGVSTGSIPKTKIEEISKIVMLETTDSEGETTKKPKDTITAEELKSCLTIMKDSADAAGIEEKEFTFDLGEEIRKAIEKGMAEAPAP